MAGDMAAEVTCYEVSRQILRYAQDDAAAVRGARALCGAVRLESLTYARRGSK